MVQFWLDNLKFLISTQNFNFSNASPSQKDIQILNIVAMTSLIVGLLLVFTKKKVIYFGISIIIMSLTILIKSGTKVSTFANVNGTNGTNGTNGKSEKFKKSDINSTTFDTGSYLIKNVNGNDPSGISNVLYINQALNFNKGDVIALSTNNSILETNIVSDIKYTTENNIPVLILLNPLQGNYSKYTTKILKISDTSPEIVSPPDGNISIGNYNGPTDPMQMSTQNYPKFNLPNQNRNDWNLEQSTMVPGGGDNYKYQGQPYGSLKCRNSDVNNPMGTINVTEYDAPPTMFGTCNVAEMTDGKYNDTLMTENQEATVSQSVNDLLFHKGNSQMLFSPVPVDTLPDNRDAFANYCYNSPTNLVNVKYASIFVNDPDKYKLVAKLARATGTEGGGAGGGGGRP